MLLLMCSGAVFADSHDGSGNDMLMGFAYTEGGVAAVPVGGRWSWRIAFPGRARTNSSFMLMKATP